MDTATDIRLEFSFGLWDRLRAGWLMCLQGGPNLAMTVAGPLFAMAMAILAWRRGTEFGPGLIAALAGFCLLAWLLVAFNVVLSYLCNRQLREPFAYRIDEAGVHVSGRTYEWTHKWPAIRRVKRGGGFLMLFFSRTWAHCLPLDRIDPGQCERIVALAAAQGVRIDG
jgi:hypothetical protein